jgi:serine/threonine protein kinase
MDIPEIIAGRFRIECEIGRGGMGTVYRATQLGLERPVAVKIIKQEFASDQHVAERFMREARTMAKLRHPHAAMIFDAGNLPDGRHFIVMEFVEGATLSECLLREGRLTAERAVSIASDICDVLIEAHRLGIVHRDLKPSNIMLSDRGVCVLDFGVAKVLATSAAADALSTHATTGSGFIVGTPRYMSPEQCIGQKVGARSDLYSVGVLLYEMLAGQPPFTDVLPSAVLVKQATMAPPPLPKLRQNIPRPLAVAVHTLLAKRPEDRPNDAAAARRLLERSLSKTNNDLPEAEPFASMVAAVNSAPGLLFRVATPLFLIAVLGTALFVWGRSNTNIQDAAAHSSLSQPQDSPATVTVPRVAEFDRSSIKSAPESSLESTGSLSLETATRLANSVSNHAVRDVRVLRLGSESGIAAIHDERARGKTHLFMMLRQGAKYRLAGRADLDKEDFRGASWTFEKIDVDGDGYDEVICTGTNARKPTAASRYVLYVPRTRETYSLRSEPGSRKDRPRVTLSSNAFKPENARYRLALQQRMKVTTGSF